MPFIADSRCGVWNIQLNVGEICGELERMLEKEFSEDFKEGSKFWLYVIQIENELNKCDTMPDFWEWFLTDEEYNNVEMWNEIQDLFVEEDEEEEICPTCKRHLDECESCECVNDCMCLELCKIEKPHLYKEDSGSEFENVCCVGCGEVVCDFNEEPPHKDDRDEAVCEECYEDLN